MRYAVLLCLLGLMEAANLLAQDVPSANSGVVAPVPQVAPIIPGTPAPQAAPPVPSAPVAQTTNTPPAIPDSLAEEMADDPNTLAQANADIEKIRKEDVTVVVKDAAGHLIPGATVKVGQTNSDFLFGCNIFGFDKFPNPVDSETYKQRFADLFNFATTGFYWSGYEKIQGQPDYAYTDKVLAWCHDHGIRVKGHPLLWGDRSGFPPWSPTLPPPELQKQRITDIMSRYKGQIEFWEVVNEPAHWNQPRIEDPYKWASEVDPKAHLIINDFRVMDDGCPKFYKLLEQAIASNVPFDGIGIQAHEPRYMRFPLPRVRDTLINYAKLGKDLYITEFTPDSSRRPMKDGNGVVCKQIWDEKAQADYAVQFYTMCFANPSVKGITWWDLADKFAWRLNGGLIKRDMKPKPAYLALQKLIRQTWRTNLQGQTDNLGTYAFRGFRGTYTITVDSNGKTAKQDFVLSQDGPKTVQVTVP